VSNKGGIYQRGDFWLDYDRAAGGKPKSNNLFIYWYDPAKRRQCRQSTGQSDVRLASDALDLHFLAVHQPTAFEQATYTVSECMTDYWMEHASKASSAEAIRSRMKLMNRFIDREAKAGRLLDPFTPVDVNDNFIKRFREWATKIDKIVARKKDEAGNWVAGQTRARSASTAEESVIMLKAAISHAYNQRRITYKPPLRHKTRNEVTATRGERASIEQIAELLDWSARGNDGYNGHATTLLPLRRYLIAAVSTVARPETILDISVRNNRSQWYRSEAVMDLNPAGRLQTKKYRAAVPITSLFHEWLCATDDWFVCADVYLRGQDGKKLVGLDGKPLISQRKVNTVRSGWDTARERFSWLPSGWGPKFMRHSTATLLGNAGVPFQQIKMMMGHETLDGSTKLYVILNPRYLGEARLALEELASELRRLVPHACKPPGPPRHLLAPALLPPPSLSILIATK